MNKEPVWSRKRLKQERAARKARGKRKGKKKDLPLFSVWPPEGLALPSIETLRELSVPDDDGDRGDEQEVNQRTRR